MNKRKGKKFVVLMKRDAKNSDVCSGCSLVSDRPQLAGVAFNIDE
jgi:hypothetical protein